MFEQPTPLKGYLMHKYKRIPQQYHCGISGRERDTEEDRYQENNLK